MLPCGLSFLIMAASVGLLALPAGAATIVGIPSAQVPTSNPSSVFDANTHATNVYGLAPGTTLNQVGMDLRDLFGTAYTPLSAEVRNVLFTDQPQGFVNAVYVVLDAPVRLANYELYLRDDTSGSRSARSFRLYADLAGTTLLDSVTILNNTGTQRYTDVYGGTSIKVTNTLLNAPLSSTYRLEFVQNTTQAFGGVRTLEFVAFAAPEPASLGLISLGLVFMATRRHRRVSFKTREAL
jgi:hypothetical protein